MPNVTISAEFISVETIPSEMDPVAAQNEPSFVYISNGAGVSGIAYIGSDSKIHISGDLYIPSNFGVGATSAGLPMGGQIVYTSNI